MCPSCTQLPALQQRQRHLCGTQVWHGSAQGTALSSGHSAQQCWVLCGAQLSTAQQCWVQHGAQLRAQHSSAGFNTVLSSGHSTAVLGSMWCSAQGMVLSSGHGAQLCSALSRVFSLARCTAVLGSTQCSAQGMMLSSGHGTAVLGSMWCSAQGTALSSGHGAQLRAQCTAVLSSEQGAQLGTVCNNAGFNTVLSSEHDAQVSMVHSSSWFNMVLSSEQGAQLCTAQQCWVQHRARLRA